MLVTSLIEMNFWHRENTFHFISCHRGPSGETLPSNATSCCLSPTIKSIPLLSTPFLLLYSNVNKLSLHIWSLIFYHGEKHLPKDRLYLLCEALLSYIKNICWHRLSETCGSRGPSHPEVELWQRRDDTARAHSDHRLKTLFIPQMREHAEVMCSATTLPTVTSLFPWMLHWPFATANY